MYDTLKGNFFPHTFKKKYPFCGLISATRNRLIKKDDDALYKGLLKEYLTEKLDFQASRHLVTFEHKKQFIFGARRKKSRATKITLAAASSSPEIP